jgi:hypothetical protein
MKPDNEPTIEPDNEPAGEPAIGPVNAPAGRPLRQPPPGSSRGPLLAAAGLGMLAAFAAGWGLGASRADPATTQTLSSRTLAAEQTPAATSTSPAAIAAVSSTPPAVVPSTGSLTAATPTAPAASGALPKLAKAKKPPVAVFRCPAATVSVSTADQLTAALKAARPGAVITLAAGTYSGRFEATRPGTAKKPIYLCGPRTAVLDGGSVGKGYALHLAGASYWRVNGFTVQNAQKGVMLDGVTGVGLQNLLVQQIGDEAVHLRTGSSLNVVRGLTIQQTGLRKPKFGEGVYIGTAQSNWCSVNDCQPDHSDGNFVVGNTISATSSEAVDIKEATSGGVLADNQFEGSGTTAADSWVDVKGNGWLIMGNTGSHSPLDGYQVHEILDGWGSRNLFVANVSELDANGYAIKVTKTHDGNVVRCNNRVTAAGQGLTNITCS